MIALTGCLASRFCRRLVDDNPAEARAHADDLIQIFGPEDVYFELQVNGIAEQDKANEGIARIAREVGRPVVGTADVHYLRREDDHANHSALLCVQTKSTLAEPKMKFDTNEFYLKDNDEMAAAFAPWPEAVPTSLEIAERCNVEIETGGQLIPQYPTPDGSDEEAYLRALAHEGLRARYGDPPPAEAVERLEMELDVIVKMGFAAYFLIVWDFVKFAKDNGIAVGPGRGSAAGSIVSYCLRITDVDPLAYDLLFERFLNAERVSMPDIDIDFSVKGRDRVMRYVQDKYGKESVAQIITFGRMFPRAATRDAARVLGYDYGAGDRLAKMIPDPIMGRAPSFDDCLKPGEELATAYASDPQAKQIVDVARGLEGIVRNSSIHAAAVVIADRPLTDIVPLQLAEDRGEVTEDGQRNYKTVTQYSMKPVEDLGLLKMDFLGLRNLDVIESALDIIERSAGERPDMSTLPLDDAKTYEMLARGDSIGVFQFESDGMREALRKVRPTEFEDLVALVALYRPGAMRYIDTYARNKRNPEADRVPGRAAALDHRVDLLGDPLPGAVDADRQADRRLHRPAGGRPAQGDRQEEPRGDGQAQADVLRGRARQRHRRDGHPGAVVGQRGRGRLLVQQVARRLLRADLLPHRVAQGQLPGRVHGGADLVGHVDQGQGAVLRLALRGDGDRRPAAGRQRVRPRLRRRRGLDPVRARRGQERRPRGGREDHRGARRRAGRSRRSGTSASGSTAARSTRRRSSRSSSAARSTRPARRGSGCSRSCRSRRAPGQKQQQDAELGPGVDLRLRRAEPGRRAAPRRSPMPAAPAGAADRRTTPSERNEMEKETLGLFLSSHPLKEVRPALRAKVDCSLAEAADRKDGEWVTVGGMIVECKRIRTKKGDMMMFATLDDLEGQVRDPRLQLRLPGQRGQDRRRQARDRARPRRPQGAGRDEGRRPGRRSRSSRPRPRSRRRARSSPSEDAKALAAAAAARAAGRAVGAGVVPRGAARRSSSATRATRSSSCGSASARSCSAATSACPARRSASTTSAHALDGAAELVPVVAATPAGPAALGERRPGGRSASGSGGSERRVGRSRR